MSLLDRIYDLIFNRGRIPEPVDDDVNRGALMLDEVYGTEWPTLVNMRKLDMLSDQYCILGQVYGSFPRGLREIRPHDTYDHGFLMRGGYARERDRALKRRWCEEIRRRLDAMKRAA